MPSSFDPDSPRQKAIDPSACSNAGAEVMADREAVPTYLHRLCGQILPCARDCVGMESVGTSPPPRDAGDAPQADPFGRRSGAISAPFGSTLNSLEGRPKSVVSDFGAHREMSSGGPKKSCGCREASVIPARTALDEISGGPEVAGPTPARLGPSACWLGQSDLE